MAKTPKWHMENYQRNINCVSKQLFWFVVACASLLLSAGAVATVEQNLESYIESKLFVAVELVQKGDIHAAIGTLDTLIKQYPKYDLPRLMKADLLSNISGRTASLSTKQAHRLDAIRSELVTRWNAKRHDTSLAVQEKLPAELVFLDRHYQYFIAVDVSKNRLYLFANKKTGVELIQTSYVTIGRNGYGKSKEGDKKTPLGVYFINGLIKSTELDPYRFGVADALPIDYPNAIDKALGRTGYGIWFHGTPKSEEFRPPQASDGCISLSTEEMNALVAKLRGKTVPVIISDTMRWVGKDKWHRSRHQFLARLADLKRAVEFQDTQLFKQLYVDSNNTSLPRATDVRFDKVAILFNRHDNLLLTAFEWQGKKKGHFKHIYWQQTGSGWQIIKETTALLPQAIQQGTKLARR